MISARFFLTMGVALLLLQTPLPGQTSTDSQSYPPELKEWENWALWGADAHNSPTVFDNISQHLRIWPSKTTINASPDGATFQQRVRVYASGWTALPGEAKYWPVEVSANGKPLAVLPHKLRPSVWLEPGEHEISGQLAWNQLPQKLALPPESGIVELNVEGQQVEFPLWDSEGHLWLNKSETPQENAGEDTISVNLYALLEDGIPLKIRLRMELIVSGKVREEVMESILPEGWNVSAINSPLPAALETNGALLLQVRPGKWEVDIETFHLKPTPEISLPSGAKKYGSLLLGFRAQPNFRIIELGQVTPIDVSMTTFPTDWRGVPVYQWQLDQSVTIEEKMRGQDEKSLASVSLSREWWLDMHGQGWTGVDNLTAQSLKDWRLDAAPGFELGSVSIDGVGQLITRDPRTGSTGIELRSRSLQLQSSGRAQQASTYPASGWQIGVEQLNFTLNLPPGWRLFSLFGSDWVRGDWLTSWSLLDIFIVLLIILAVSRIWGFKVGGLVAATIVLTFKEPGAPQYLWLALLLPSAIAKYAQSSAYQRPLLIWKWATFGVFVWACLPFVWGQIQQAIYPQLEGPSAYGASTLNSLAQSEGKRSRSGAPFFSSSASTTLRESAGDFSLAGGMGSHKPSESFGEAAKTPLSESSYPSLRQSVNAYLNKNLAYDAKAKIQTGPGIPSWQWRKIQFGWNGPVSTTETFMPVLIPPAVSRTLSVLGVLGLFSSVYLLVGGSGVRYGIQRARLSTSILLFSLISPLAAHAQFPNQEILDGLRARLLETPPPADQSAVIPHASALLQDDTIKIEAEIHTSRLTALPLPGQLPAWSPVRVTVNGKETPLLRQNGYLWAALPAGIHRVQVEGRMPSTEWEWAFQLKPRRVHVTAPDWITTGLSPDGVPDQQIIFSPRQKEAGQSSTYDRQDFPSPVQVVRNLEIGLEWQARTTVRRLASAERALTIRVPLLPNERLLSSNFTVTDNIVEVRLPAGVQEISWQGELPITEELSLNTKAADGWVELWKLSASPVWNVRHSGLSPVYENDQQGIPSALIPTWSPWPGESVKLSFTRPEAIRGATVTVHRAAHSIDVGIRQTTSTLTLALSSSLGGDFDIQLPSGAEITSLTVNRKEIPARAESGKLVVPINVGEQEVQVQWKMSSNLKTIISAPPVSLPVEASNVSVNINVPDSRWIWGVSQAEMSPAVKFWIILSFGLIFALLLSRLPLTPLSTSGWMLLSLGLTQASPLGAILIVSWLFLLKWRQNPAFRLLPPNSFNFTQIALVILTVLSIITLFLVVAAGLLGQPEMFIAGNNSSSHDLNWYFARTPGELPSPWIASVSIWWYRAAMLAWALWLAILLLGQLEAGWKAFWSGGAFKAYPEKQNRDDKRKHKSNLVTSDVETKGPGETPPPLQTEK